jgi:ribosome-binding protein aMBF1 (putative translation factor)
MVRKDIVVKDMVREDMENNLDIKIIEDVDNKEDTKVDSIRDTKSNRGDFVVEEI